MPESFRHSLDLALRLMDTTTGRPVAGRGLKLLRNGARVFPLEKDSGTLVFIGFGREDFTLTVEAGGYEPLTVSVCYDQLDRAMPQLDLHLIPGRAYAPGEPCLTLEGTLPGIRALDAVKAGDSPCLIREFDPRKRIMTIFNPHRLELDRKYYALVDPDRQRYEPFVLEQRLSETTCKLDRRLETEFGNYFPVCPMVFGRASPDGRYCLRVRDSTTDARWLLRWEDAAGTHFCRMDLRDARPLEEVEP